MKKVLNLLIVFILIAVMGCAHAPASKEQPQPTVEPYQPNVGLKIVDAVLVRIPMIAASSVSTGVFIAISPVVSIMGIGEPMARAMVETPWRFTAARPLGDFTGATKDGRPIYMPKEW